jgi:hypothetical protein
MYYKFKGEIEQVKLPVLSLSPGKPEPLHHHWS